METNEIRQKMEGLCICRQCPSFVDCSERVAYCLQETRKSNCIKDQRGCICGGCSVWKQLGFKNGYYCVLGSEKKQS
jgi:hypothetical protein